MKRLRENWKSQGLRLEKLLVKYYRGWNYMANTKEYTLKIGDAVIPYKIKDSTKAKNIRLVIDNNGLHVIKPLRVKISDVERVLKEKSSWIYKHYVELLQKKQSMPVRKWETGETLLYLGQNCKINIMGHKKSIASVSFDGDAFFVYMDENTTGEERNLLIESVFKKWYRKAAEIVLNERLEHFCRITGLKFRAMRLKEQKTRWGSCSKDGNLNFNWKLIMAPLWVVDYVVLHEVSHLRHLNHSKDFWSLVTHYMPDYKKAQEWLKNHGAALSFNY
jgi:predicted metal-dependent hydrolase